MYPLNIIFVAVKYLNHQRLLVISVTAFVSWQMQEGHGSGFGRGSGKSKGKKRESRRQRDMGAASGEVTPENEIEEDDPQEADADTIMKCHYSLPLSPFSVSLLDAIFSLFYDFPDATVLSLSVSLLDAIPRRSDAPTTDDT